MSPKRVLALPDASLRSVGLSTRKVEYVRLASEFAAAGNLEFSRLQKLEDEEVLRCLTQLRGIGPWTANMLLMFGLGRLDILPTGDLALRKGFAVHLRLEQLPTPEQMRSAAEAWRPFRSIACIYMWRIAQEFTRTSPGRQKP